MTDSFEALAARVLPPLLDQVIAALARLSARSRPHDAPVKPLRKLVGKLRDHLDLFAPAYPAPGLVPLRAAVDEGYDRLGEFKDLFDVQAGDLERRSDARYAPDDLHERRARLLAWRDGFVRPAAARAARGFLADAHPPSGRARADFVPRFWGKPGPRAHAAAPALVNLARLAERRFADARAAWRDALALRSLHHERRREAFHDARKRVRWAAKLVAWFPALVDDAPACAPSLEVVAELARRAGRVLDLLNARALAHDGGHARRARHLDDRITKEWRHLRRWARRHDADGALRQLRERVRGTLADASDIPT